MVDLRTGWLPADVRACSRSSSAGRVTKSRFARIARDAQPGAQPRARLRGGLQALVEQAAGGRGRFRRSTAHARRERTRLSGRTRRRSPARAARRRNRFEWAVAEFHRPCRARRPPPPRRASRSASFCALRQGLPQPHHRPQEAREALEAREADAKRSALRPPSASRRSCGAPACVIVRRAPSGAWCRSSLRAHRLSAAARAPRSRASRAAPARGGAAPAPASGGATPARAWARRRRSIGICARPWRARRRRRPCGRPPPAATRRRGAPSLMEQRRAPRPRELRAAAARAARRAPARRRRTRGRRRRMRPAGAPAPPPRRRAARRRRPSTRPAASRSISRSSLGARAVLLRLLARPPSPRRGSKRWRRAGLARRELPHTHQKSVPQRAAAPSAAPCARCARAIAARARSAAAPPVVLHRRLGRLVDERGADRSKASARLRSWLRVSSQCSSKSPDLVRRGRAAAPRAARDSAGSTPRPGRPERPSS